MVLSQDALNVIIGLSILVGVVECFLGYRIFKVVLGLIGFLVGGTLASAMGYTLSQQEREARPSA